jgi:integrase/recombinase XerC
MQQTIRPRSNSKDLLSESQLAPYVDAFTRHLTERQYSSRTVGNYLACLSHFAVWSNQCRQDIHEINEDVVRRFLNDHLPQSDCAGPVQKTHNHLRAALRHLLTVLRANSVIAEHRPGNTPVDEELRRFDGYMKNVRGLAPRTRSRYLHIVGLLLLQQFGERPVVFSAIKPADIRRFVATCQERYSAPSSSGALASALSNYFRFRTTQGDQVHGLIGAVPRPANWQLASLPKALSSTEVGRLLGSLGHNGPSARRADAIVRCALDLGLRSCEIAGLGLDDIDWRAGTITLRRTKGGREDVLPLPEATGRAIANYLKFERPQTSNRSVFVRIIAPLDQPIGSSAIRRVIRQAYARAGLPYTRAHILRHTMASRLLEGGSPLKEVADVLRHRSLNTTLIYAKLDSKNLAAVALPWPGYAA